MKLSGLLISAYFVLSAGLPATLPEGAKAEADRVMGLTYGAFIDYKTNSPHPFPFDFSSDGCSPPATNLGLAETFDQPCQLHDFGYRNYGGNSGLSPDEATRTWIDDRFHDEMDRLCRDKHQGVPQQGNQQVCLYQSDSIYAQIRQHGSDAFFNH